MKTTKRPLTILLLTVIITATISICVILSVPTQNQVAKGADLVWEKTFGGVGDDRAFYAVATPDGGYLVVGSSTSFEQGKTVACMAKLDAEGNQLWNRTYTENAGAEFRYACNIANGFLLVGNTFLTSGGTNGYIMKTDTEGNLVWNITLNADVTKGIDKLFSATIEDNNLIAVGLAELTGDNTSSNIWVIKLDDNGNVIWNKICGNTAGYAGRGITITQDDAYIVAGYADRALDANYDFLVLKLDKNGNMLWNRTYGGAESDKAYAIAVTQGGYIIAGDTRSQGSGDSDTWVIKIDPNGEKLWERSVGGSNFDSPTFITASQDGSCLVAGTTFSFGNGQRDFWLLKLGSTGEVTWTCTAGRSNYEEAYTVIPVGNNSYVMIGWTKSIGAGQYDFYIIKLAKTN